MPNEAADVLAVLYPALLRFAEKQLRTRQLNAQLAEDLVQEAMASWFASGTKLETSAQVNTYLRKAIDHRAENQRVRRPDALDRNPVSIETPSGRGHRHWRAEAWSAYFNFERDKLLKGGSK